MDSSDEEDELSLYLNKNKTEELNTTAKLENEQRKPVFQKEYNDETGLVLSSVTIDKPKSLESTTRANETVKFTETIPYKDATDGLVVVGESLFDSKLAENNKGIKNKHEVGVAVKSQVEILELLDKPAKITRDQDSHENDIEIQTDFSYIEPDIVLAPGFEILNNPLVDYDTDVLKTNVTSPEHNNLEITNNIDSKNSIEADDNQTDVATKPFEIQDIQVVETCKQSDMGGRNIPQVLKPSTNIDFVGLENMKAPTESSDVPNNQKHISSMIKSMVVGSFSAVEHEQYLEENPATGIDVSSVEIKASELNNANMSNYNENSTAEINKLSNKESNQSTAEATTSNNVAAGSKSSGNRFVVLREEDWRAISEALNQTWNESTRSAMRALTLMNIVSKLGIPLDLDDNSNTQSGGSNGIANAKGSNCQHVNNRSAKSEHKTKTELSDEKIDSDDRDTGHDAISKNFSDFSSPDRTHLDQMDNCPSNIHQSRENIKKSTNSTTSCVKRMDKSLPQNKILSKNKLESKLSSSNVALDSESKGDSQAGMENKGLSRVEVKSVLISANETRKSVDSNSGIRNNIDLYDDTKSKGISKDTEKVSNVAGSSLLSSGRFVRKGNKLVFQRGLSMKAMHNVKKLPDTATTIVEKESNTSDTEAFDAHDAEFSDNENSTMEISEGSDDENVITIEINPPEKHIHVAEGAKEKVNGTDMLDIISEQANEKSNIETGTKQLKTNNANNEGLKDTLNERVDTKKGQKVLPVVDTSHLRFVEDGVVKINAIKILNPICKGRHDKVEKSTKAKSVTNVKVGVLKQKSADRQLEIKMTHKAKEQSVIKKRPIINQSKSRKSKEKFTKTPEVTKQTLEQKYKAEWKIACDNEDIQEKVESNNINRIKQEKEVDFENEKLTLDVNEIDVKQHSGKIQESIGEEINLIKDKTKKKATKGSKVKKTNDTDKDGKNEPEKLKNCTTRNRATKSLNLKESICFKTSPKKEHITKTTENESVLVRKEKINTINDSNSGQNTLDVSESISSESTNPKPKTRRKTKGADGENTIQSNVKTRQKKDININESSKTENDNPTKQSKVPVQKMAPRNRKIHPKDSESNSENDLLKKEISGQRDNENVKIKMNEDESFVNGEVITEDIKLPLKKRKNDIFDHMEVTTTSDNISLDHSSDTKAKIMEHSESTFRISDPKSTVKGKRGTPKKRRKKTGAQSILTDSAIKSEGKPVNTKPVEKKSSKKKQASKLPKPQTNATLVKNTGKDTEDGNRVADIKNDGIDKESGKIDLKFGIGKKRKASKDIFEASDGDLCKTKEKISFRDASPNKVEKRSPRQKRDRKHSAIKSERKPVNTKPVEKKSAKKKQASKLPKAQTNVTLVKNNGKDTVVGNRVADIKNNGIDKESGKLDLKSGIGKKRKASKDIFEASNGDLCKTKEKVSFRDASPKKVEERSLPQKRDRKHSGGKDESRNGPRKHITQSWKEMLSGDEFKDDLQVSPVKHINVRKVIKGILKPNKNRWKNGEKIENNQKESEGNNSTGKDVGKCRNKQSKRLADEILENLKKRNGGGLDTLKNYNSKWPDDIVRNSGIQTKVQTVCKPCDPETVRTKGAINVSEKSEELPSTISKDTVGRFSYNLNGKVVIVKDRLNSKTVSIEDSPVKSTSERTITKFSDSITVSSQKPSSYKTSSQFPEGETSPNKSQTAKTPPKVLASEKSTTKLPDSFTVSSQKPSSDKISPQFPEVETSFKQSTAKSPSAVLTIVKTATHVHYNYSKPNLNVEKLSQSSLKETKDLIKASAKVSPVKMVNSPLSDSVAKLKSLLDKAVGGKTMQVDT